MKKMKSFLAVLACACASYGYHTAVANGIEWRYEEWSGYYYDENGNQCWESNGAKSVSSDVVLPDTVVGIDTLVFCRNA